MRRLPARLGSAHDHCLTSFDRVQVPREAMLGGAHGRITGDGVFASEVPERRRRFMTSIDRIMTGRICLIAGTVGAARAGLTMAVRYGRNRHITGLTESSRLAVFDLRSHHGPLVEAIATVYAMNMLYREAARRWSERDRSDQTALGQAARFVSVAKAWITWQSRGVGAQVRERCGAQGLLVNNGIVQHLMVTEGVITAEGDNQAIMVQAATELLLAHRPAAAAVRARGRGLADADFMGELLAAAEGIWLDRAQAARRAAPAEALARRNHAMGPALRAVDVYGHRIAAGALADAVAAMPAGPDRELLEDLLRLFVLRGVAAHSGDLLCRGFLTGEQVEELPVLMEGLLARLAGQADVLVEAFAVPEEFFEGIPIASADYIAAYDDPEGVLAPGGAGSPISGSLRSGGVTARPQPPDRDRTAGVRGGEYQSGVLPSEAAGCGQGHVEGHRPGAARHDVHLSAGVLLGEVGRRRDFLPLQGEDRQGRLDRPGGPECVSEDALGRRDGGRGPGEDAQQGEGFGRVAEAGRGAVGVDVADVARCAAGIGEGLPDGLLGAAPLGVGGGGVVGVRGRAVAA